MLVDGTFAELSDSEIFFKILQTLEMSRQGLQELLNRVQQRHTCQLLAIMQHLLC